jgi:hypothetical protein
MSNPSLQNELISSWLESSVKSGYGRYGQLFAEGGWEDLDMLAQYPPNITDLRALLSTGGGVTKPQLAVILEGLDRLQRTRTHAVTNNCTLMNWLERITPGFKRFASLFIMAGTSL